MKLLVRIFLLYLLFYDSCPLPFRDIEAGLENARSRLPFHIRILDPKQVYVSLTSLHYHRFVIMQRKCIVSTVKYTHSHRWYSLPQGDVGVVRLVL